MIVPLLKNIPNKGMIIIVEESGQNSGADSTLMTLLMFPLFQVLMLPEENA